MAKGIVEVGVLKGEPGGGDIGVVVVAGGVVEGEVVGGAWEGVVLWGAPDGVVLMPGGSVVVLVAVVVVGDDKPADGDDGMLAGVLLETEV